MSHKLTFVKISPAHEFAGVGFAGNIFIILNALSLLKKEDRLYVDMETNECACTESVEVNGTRNCWEYYFEQVSLEEHFKALDSFSIPTNIHYEDKEVFTHPDKFSNLKDKFYKNFRLKEYLKLSIAEYYNKNIKDMCTLGVQIRLTDMIYHHNVKGLDSYIDKTKKILEECPQIEQIFLATDDEKIINPFRQNVDVPVLCHEGIFRSNDTDLHIEPYQRFKNSRNLHRYNLGVECLKDILILSKCDYLLKADQSSISIVASILNENIKKVYKL